MFFPKSSRYRFGACNTGRNQKERSRRFGLFQRALLRSQQTVVGNLIRHLISKFQFNVWSLSGSPNGKQALRILFIGSEIDKRFFTHLIFDGEFSEICLGRMWSWHLILVPWRLKNHFDILLVLGRMKAWRHLSNINRFIIPTWIGGEIDLTADMDKLRKSNRTLRSSMAKIKRNHLDFIVTKDPALFDLFYHRMYLPYMRERHRSRAIYRKPEEMRKSFDHGELLLIKKGQTYIAGVLIDYQIMKTIPRTTQLGVLDGNADYVREGALTAIYYYTIKYLKDKGHQRFNIGLSRPFLSDGVLRYKRNWGMNLVCETTNAYLLCLLSVNRATRSFLLSNPFISMDQGEPVCTLFHETDAFATDRGSDKSKFNAIARGLAKRIFEIGTHNQLELVSKPGS